ncbi:hypothetical protein B484DRAFT_412242 [Ochromonadaceae sp. CCMP2298]|nr:hypothetical protein B484DRAFT_412242 [Ochromonadaceae sp. CCMP2298]
MRSVSSALPENKSMRRRAPVPTAPVQAKTAAQVAQEASKAPQPDTPRAPKAQAPPKAAPKAVPAAPSEAPAPEAPAPKAPKAPTQAKAPPAPAPAPVASKTARSRATKTPKKAGHTKGKTNTLFSTGIMDQKKKKYNEVFGGDSVSVLDCYY